MKRIAIIILMITVYYTGIAQTVIKSYYKKNIENYNECSEIDSLISTVVLANSSIQRVFLLNFNKADTVLLFQLIELDAHSDSVLFYKLPKHYENIIGYGSFNNNIIFYSGDKFPTGFIIKTGLIRRFNFVLLSNALLEKRKLLFAALYKYQNKKFSPALVIFEDKPYPIKMNSKIQRN